MVWLGLEFDTIAMAVSLHQDKLSEIQLKATLKDLCTLLGKLYVSKVCPPARLFLNRMLDTLRQCLEKRSFTLSPEFRKDIGSFDHFLPNTGGTFIIHQDSRNPVDLYIDICM